MAEPFWMNIPCRVYVDWLLDGALRGKPQQPSLWSKVKYAIPAALLFMAVFDFGDVLVNFHSIITRRGGIVITLISWTTTPINYFQSFYSLVWFMRSRGAILDCLTALQALGHHFPTRRGDERPFKIAKRMFVLFSLARLVAYPVFAYFRAHIYAGVSFPFLFWQMPASFVLTFTDASHLVTNLLLYPLAFFFIYACIDLTNKSLHFNARLVSSLRTGGQLATENWLDTEECLHVALHALNRAFSQLLLTFVVGRMFVIFSFIASLFSLDSPISWMSATRLGGHLLMESALLGAIIVYPVKLAQAFHPTKYLWAQLLNSRRKHEKQAYGFLSEVQMMRDAMSCILQRPDAVYVGGVAPVTMPFAVTLATMFAGVICFYFDQNDNNDHSGLDRLIVAVQNLTRS